MKTPIIRPDVVASSIRRTEASRATASGMNEFGKQHRVAQRQHRQLRWNRQRTVSHRAVVDDDRLVLIAHERSSSMWRPFGAAGYGTDDWDGRGPGPGGEPRSSLRNVARSAPGWFRRVAEARERCEDLPLHVEEERRRAAALQHQRSRCWATSRASSQSLQRTANGSARSRRSEISSPHSKQ